MRKTLLISVFLFGIMALAAYGQTYCVPDWKCFDAMYEGYQSMNCSWPVVNPCAYGCTGGQCNLNATTCYQGYICKSDYYRAYQYSNCGQGVSVFCKYGCRDGSCIQNSCTDSDGSIDNSLDYMGYRTKGTVILNEINYSDYCQDADRLHEYYCAQTSSPEGSSSTLGESMPSCTSQGYTGCSNGACVSQQVHTCNDVDGYDMYRAGYVRETIGTQVTDSYDTCLTSTILAERICQGATIAGTTTTIVNYTCPNGCANGACTYCTGGWKCSSPTYRGYQSTGCDWSNQQYCPYGCLNGVCQQPSCNVTYFCVNSSRYYQNGNCTQSLVQNCAYGCANGNCNPPTCTPTYYCNNSARYYLNAACNRSLVSNCPNGCSNGECIALNCTAGYYCNGSVSYYLNASCGASPGSYCSFGCSNGACLPPTCTAGYYCNGSTSSYRSTDCLVSSATVCDYGCNSATGQCNPPTCTPTYYCNNSALYYLNAGCSWNLVSNCPNGCSNGACITSSIICNDTDGGLNYGVKGTTKITTYRNGVVSSTSSSTDACWYQSINGTYQYSLTEYYCSGTSKASVNYICPRRCVSGSCR
jgi:hypothetical protein